MLTRREWLGGGVLGAGVTGEQQAPFNREQADGIVRSLETLAEEAVNASRGCYTGVCSAAAKIRDGFALYFRTNQKFPDFCDVGVNVFHDIYDWHVRNRQPLNVGRTPDGRYGISFMFSRLVLRPDVVPDYIGLPYDLRP